jgi:predicted transcriptional regulator
MTVAEAAGKIEGTVVACAAEAATREIRGGYASDLLSDVMGNSREGDLWVTLQKHVNIVAVAQLNGLAAIVLVNGRRPEPETTARAEEEHIPIISTELPTFDVAGILHGLGIRGRRSA